MVRLILKTSEISSEDRKQMIIECYIIPLLEKERNGSKEKGRREREIERKRDKKRERETETKREKRIM